MSQYKVEKLSWDSDFFQREVGQLLAENSIESISESFDVIYVYSDRDLIISGYKNTLKQTKVIFSKEINKIEEKKSGAISSVFKISEYKEKLYDLAYESGKYSRFLKDKYFGLDKFKLLYQKWVDNSIDGVFADDVLVYFLDNKVQGFVTYKINKDHAQIGLIAVSPSAQGKGIGSNLIGSVEQLLFEKQVKELRIPTQLENEKACKFYSKLGYSIMEKEYIQHFWNYDTIQ